ncbi:MAG: hypothetical protein OXI58_21835 [Gemmatimonadota bacterium]|nr:hypothetical protein [Gemmatimonadota bacterium]
MAEFDIVSKYLVQHYPDDFARFALGRDDVEGAEVIDPEQLTVKARQADSLLRVQLGGETVLVHTEFQTTDSTKPPMARRMVGYIGRIVEQYGLPVVSIVLYLRPAAGRRDPGHYLQDRPGHRILVEYQVIRLSELDGQRILKSGPVGLLPFVPLMRPTGPSADWLQTCVREVQAQPLDQATKADCLAGMSLLSGLLYARETVAAIFFKEGLMDMIHESPVAQYLTQQGIEQGSRERAIEDLLDVLEIRFALDAADPLADRIRGIEDSQRLKQLHRAAIQVESLKAFQALLDADE